MMLSDRIRRAVTTYLATLPFSDKEILRDQPIQFGVLGVDSVADYVVCDVSYFVVIILCEVPTTKRAALEAREHLKSMLSATDTQFGVLATGTDPDNWFFSENRRNNWFVEVPRSIFESQVARWHPDTRQSALALDLQEKIKESNDVAHRRLRQLRKWCWTAISFGIGFLGIGLLLIWYILK